jgi:hypothetical protein
MVRRWVLARLARQQPGLEWVAGQHLVKLRDRLRTREQGR